MGIENLKVMLEEHEATRIEHPDIDVPCEVYKIDAATPDSSQFQEALAGIGYEIAYAPGGTKEYFEELVNNPKLSPQMVNRDSGLIRINDTEALDSFLRERKGFKLVDEHNGAYIRESPERSFKDSPLKDIIEIAREATDADNIKDGTGILLQKGSGLYMLIREISPLADIDTYTELALYGATPSAF
jgi:hypothetical protein